MSYLSHDHNLNFTQACLQSPQKVLPHPTRCLEKGHVFTCLQILMFVFVRRCTGGKGRDLQPHQSMPKSYVQAVSNKLLNLIKRKGIILRSPEGSWTSAVMNTFCLIMTSCFGRRYGNNLLENQKGAGVTPVQTEC